MSGNSRTPLTIYQLECLHDLVSGPLFRSRAGWGSSITGTRWHSGQTIDALARKGLCTVTDRHRIYKGEARITPKGLTAQPAVRS